MLKMVIQGTLVAFNYTNVFRVSNKHVTGKAPQLLQYGLTMGRQHRLQRALTRRLSPSISFDYVYLGLAQEEMDCECRSTTSDQKGECITLTFPEIEIGMHPEGVFDLKVKVDPQYIFFAPETFLREKYLQWNLKAWKHFIGNDVNAKMQYR